MTLNMEPNPVNRVFILSPAFCGGKRAQMVMSERAQFALAAELRNGGARLGDLFSFMSGLYFRGKLAYASKFANPPHRIPGALVVTPGRGLRPPQDILTLRDLQEIAQVEVDENNPAYTAPLTRDARLIAESISADCQVVLLGSIATSKYLGILGETFGKRLRFPIDFVGRGDMSRGGLLLRRVTEGEELEYVDLEKTSRHGTRPPKLPRLR